MTTSATAAIVVPVYATLGNHRLDYLDQTLQSVQKQTHRGLVCVVVDDGSTVDVQAFVKDQKYDRLRYVRRERGPSDLRTASNALNFGIDLCLRGSGDVFTSEEARNLSALAYLHSDDILTVDSIEMRLSALSDSVAFVHTDFARIDPNSRLLGINRWSKRNDEYAGNILAGGFGHHTTMWTMQFVGMLMQYVSERYGQNGIFDSRLSHGEDMDVSLSGVEAADRASRIIAHIPKIAYLYRQHPNSISGDKVSLEYRKGQEELINLKHFSEADLAEFKRKLFLRRLTRDFPWSLGTSLPEEVKRYLRPVRDNIKRIGAKKNMTSEEIENLESILAALS
ncbi:MAG: glycosyltransferase [Nanoarchaeota archaeon]